MIHEYSRTELLVEKEGLQRLKDATVMVLGVGGVGSHCIEALARSGVGRLILVDNDKVTLTNINRQSIAYHSTIGQYKTKLMKDRIWDISSEIEVITHEKFILPENLHEIFDRKVDYIIDAIDTVTAKLALVEYAKQQDIPIISCMGTGNKLHPELFDLGKLLRALTTVFHVQAINRQIDFQIFLRGEVTEYLVGDALRLNQILTNLLSNAVKFTPAQGSVNLNIETLRRDDHRIWLRFEVKDTGRGIAPENIHRTWPSHHQKLYGNDGRIHYCVQ